MVKASAFNTPSKYLNADGAKGMDGLNFIIYDVKPELIEDESRPKLAVYFKGVEKPLILNKTNRDTLSTAWGDETDEWKGRSVMLLLIPDSYNGKPVMSIRLKAVP
jgi:hypothetical protein